MTGHGELELHAGKGVERAESAPLDIVGLINTLAKTPSLTLEQVAIVERLVALQERQQAQGRKEQFHDALRLCQMEMPRVEKNGLIDPKGAAIPYAKLEDLDACIRPIYHKHGFTVTYDAPMTSDGGKIRNIAHFSCAGHTEDVEISAAPSNRSSGRLALTDAQKVKQTITECRRHLLEIFFNVITKNAEEPGGEVISEDQARELQSAFEDVGGDAIKFLGLLDADKFSNVTVGKLDFAYKLIASKRQERRK